MIKGYQQIKEVIEMRKKQRELFNELLITPLNDVLKVCQQYLKGQGNLKEVYFRNKQLSGRIKKIFPKKSEGLL